MDAISIAEPKCSYSWWWDSHISPKNSKWLQDNLTDMDNKIKAMILLIEEDADSFARRAEMYYKKRPDLMKLVEEFYRAYRALVERYDHVTGALRQAHRTIAVAFPNQLQSTVPDEPPSGLLDTGDEPTYETGTQTMPKFMQWDAESLNWLFTDEDLKKNLDLKNNGANLSEFKKLEEEVLGMSNENKNLKKEIAMESLRAEKAESELQCQKNAIFKLKSELESAYQRYQISEGRISDLESELSVSQAHCLHLNDEISIKASKLSITEDQCLGLEREKTCLQSEIDKCKLIVSKQHEEALNLLKENQNFQNQINSESKRADTAEVDSTRLRDTILRLKSELESTLLQYRFSQGRISDLEAEISHTKEQLKNINHEMVRHASKLNLAEDQCQLLLEENKTLQHELEIALKKITSQDKEIIMKDEELNFLKQSVEFECQRRTQAEITEKALLTKVNNLEQRVENQEEEIRRGAEKLRQLELRKAGLEEEIKHILDENNGLNEENFLSVSKIICLQDEINSLMASKHKIQDELRFKTEAVMFLQQELSSYKSSRNELEEGRHELMVKLKRMELRDATIEEEMRSLHDENIGLYEKYFSFSSKIVNLQDDMICLKESSYKLEDELQFHLEEKNTLQNEKFVLEERHHRLKEHVEEVNRNVTSLQAVVKELLDGNKELRDEKACHLMLMEIMAEKNVFLENSLSDSNAELKILFEKIKGLEEYSEFLHENVHKFISSEPVLISHSDVMLSGNYSVMGSSITDLNVEFDVLRGKVKALEEPCQSLYYQNSHLITQNSKLVSQVEKVGLHLQNLENRFVILEEKQVNEEKDLALYHIRELDGKEEHDNHLCFFRNLLSDLSNQIYLLKSKNQTTKEELEEEHLRSVKGEIDSFIMKLFLVDLNEANQFLSNKCQKYVDKLEEVKIAVFELKQEWNDKLLEGLHAMMNKYDMKKARLEKPFPFTLLEQLALILAEHRTQKKDLEQESLLRNKEISILHTKNQELMEINEQSRKREETLSFKTETMCGRVFELQEACQASQLEISKLLEEIKSLSVKLQKLRDQNEALEEENDTLLEEAMTQEHLCLIFKNFNSEKTSDIDWLIRDVTCLYRITGQLDQEIRVINKNMRALEEENMQLKEYRAHVVILENKIHLSRSALRRHNKEAERMNKFVEIQSTEPPLNPELEIESLQKSNKMLEVELETVGMKLKNTTSELQMSIEECGFYKAESAKLQHELQTSSIMEFICKAKLFELTQSVSQINIPFEEELKDRVEELGRENKGLKAELNALAPVVVSLEKEITSLEEHTLSLTNLHILNSKRKQGNILASLQHKKSSQARGKHQSPRASVVIMDLKKLRAKVKVLQKEVTDTEGLLEQGKVTSCTTETRKNRACKSSGPPRKQDIILDLKKSDNICKDIELDHVLSSSHREEGDRARILWDDIETSENPSSELTLEKELSVDNSVLLISYNESLQKWMDRVSKSISADAQRLFALEKSLDELKMKLLTTEMKSQADYAVKETEEALIKVTEFNQKLAKMAESFSLSSDSSKLRRRVLERVQRGAEKIDGLELKLQKVQCIVLKLQEEHLESKVAKPEERRSKLPLKDLIYGNQSNPKQMKRRFCGCMRFKKKEK